MPLFASLDRERLERIAECSVVRTLENGAAAVRRGEPAVALMVVESGALSAVHDSADGRRLRLGEFRAPCAVDKVAVLDSGRHTATWEAVGRTRVRRVPRDDLIRLLEDVPSVRWHVLAHLAAEVRRHQAERVRTTLDDATTRLAAWLVQQAATRGVHVVLPHGQEGLGESIGASRVTTNRSLQELARCGLVRLEPNAVHVLAPEVLARRASGSL